MICHPERSEGSLSMGTEMLPLRKLRASAHSLSMTIPILIGKVHQRGRAKRGKNMDPPKLLVQGVTKIYRDGRRSLEALAPIDLAIATGEFVSIIGPSGCGKSTLFNIIAGVEKASSGMIAIDGNVGEARAGKSGYMPQQPLLLPWRTIEENVMLGLDIRRTPRKKARQEAYELLKRFGLADFAQNYPATLSGGMRQRIALLRTVLFNHDFLLLDEPFGALDALTRLSSQMWLLDLWQDFHSSVLFITHDVREAILLSDRVYIFSARPGRVLRLVEVDLPRPRQPEQLAWAQSVQLEQELVTLLLKEQKP